MTEENNKLSREVNSRKPSRWFSVTTIKKIFKTIWFIGRETFSYDVDNRERMTSQFLYIIAAIFFVAILWSIFAEIDQVVSAQGKVISSDRLQSVEHFEGGRVSKILVKTGQVVKKGDLLISLSPVQTQGELNVAKESFTLLTIRLARLNAELTQTPVFDVPELVRKEFPDIVRTEQSLLKERLAQYSSQLSQKRNDISTARSKLTAAEVGLTAAREESGVIRQLVERGLEARLSLIRADKMLAEANTAMLSAREELSKAESGLLSFSKEYQSGVLAEMTKTRSELSGSRENVKVSGDKNERTAVRAPISGTVNRVLVTTEGESVKPGEPIVEIVPSESSIIIEAKVSPGDIGFVRLKQRALVKLTTYDYSIFGALDGSVSVIGSDSVTEERGEQFYIVKIDLNKSYIDSGKANLMIIPGMIAQVDIVTGKRTAFQYLFSPITKVMQESFREK
jgi:adhesin transport system membrane fusion protein